MNIDKTIDGIIEREGGYVWHEDDRGGPTCWGITQVVARANDYRGDMKALPRELAHAIYRQRYVIDPGFNKVAKLSGAVADELADTGVNMGTVRASRFLQQALNAMNRNGKDYPDLVVDGRLGPTSLKTLKAYLDKRRKQGGEAVLLTALNVLQGAKYIEIAEHDHSQQSFVFGWLKHRVAM